LELARWFTGIYRTRDFKRGTQSPSNRFPDNDQLTSRGSAAVMEGNIMPTLYWYFPIIMFSCVCDLVSSPFLANGTAVRASAPTASDVAPAGPAA
jgi:hypothetical protein